MLKKYLTFLIIIINILQVVQCSPSIVRKKRGRKKVVIINRLPPKPYRRWNIVPSSLRPGESFNISTQLVSSTPSTTVRVFETAYRIKRELPTEIYTLLINSGCRFWKYGDKRKNKHFIYRRHVSHG